MSDYKVDPDVVPIVRNRRQLSQHDAEAVRSAYTVCYHPPMSERGETDLEIAVRLVAEAHRTVEQQRQRIARLKEGGKPTFRHEQMLRAFESTLQIFEHDERRIRERMGSGYKPLGV
jgi:hypothetical protein